MSKNTLVIILVLVVVFGAWYLMSQYKTPDISEISQEETEQEIVNQGEGEETGYVITFTDSGYAPSPLTVKVGDTVKFVNNSGSDFWPASAMHPTHTVYPGSDIEKCDTPEEVNIFDACKGIAPGGSWEFTFNEAGEWGYHDHLNAKLFGKVIVE